MRGAFINSLKRKMKFGPRLSRQMRAEYLGVQINAPRRELKPEILSKIRRKLERLAHSESPAVMRFIRQMKARYSELHG